MDAFIDHLITVATSVAFPLPVAVLSAPEMETATRFFKRVTSPESLAAIVQYGHFVLAPYPPSPTFADLVAAQFTACFIIMPGGFTDQTVDLRYVGTISLIGNNQQAPAVFDAIADNTILSINMPASLLTAGGRIRTAAIPVLAAANKLLAAAQLPPPQPPLPVQPQQPHPVHAQVSSSRHIPETTEQRIILAGNVRGLYKSESYVTFFYNNPSLPPAADGPLGAPVPPAASPTASSNFRSGFATQQARHLLLGDTGTGARHPLSQIKDEALEALIYFKFGESSPSDKFLTPFISGFTASPITDIAGVVNLGLYLERFYGSVIFIPELTAAMRTFFADAALLAHNNPILNQPGVGLAALCNLINFKLSCLSKRNIVGNAFAPAAFADVNVDPAATLKRLLQIDMTDAHTLAAINTLQQLLMTGHQQFQHPTPFLLQQQQTPNHVRGGGRGSGREPYHTPYTPSHSRGEGGVGYGGYSYSGSGGGGGYSAGGGGGGGGYDRRSSSSSGDYGYGHGGSRAPPPPNPPLSGQKRTADATFAAAVADWWDHVNDTVGHGFEFPCFSWAKNDGLCAGCATGSECKSKDKRSGRPFTHRWPANTTNAKKDAVIALLRKYPKRL